MVSFSFFKPLTWDNFNGEPTGYTVEYRAETGDVLTQTITDPMERFLILGGLESYTNYTIFIIAKNTQFSSGPSQAVSSTTIESGEWKLIQIQGKWSPVSL